MSDIKYKRVLLKLSGEVLAGETKTGINPDNIISSLVFLVWLFFVFFIPTIIEKKS